MNWLHYLTTKLLFMLLIEMAMIHMVMTMKLLLILPLQVKMKEILWKECTPRLTAFLGCMMAILNYKQ